MKESEAERHLQEDKQDSYRQTWRANPYFKVCKSCHQKERHYVQGIYIAPLCDRCMDALPPVPSGMRRCPQCLQPHPNLKHSYCASCRSAYCKARRDPEKAHNRHIRYTYSLTAEQKQAMFEAQGGVCAACGQAETQRNSKSEDVEGLQVDHDHQTGKVRALLCRSCNTALGNLKDDPERVQLLFVYIAQKKAENR